MDLNDLDLCIVDIETTGARSQGRIIEIGVLKIEKGKLTDQFHTLINPQQPIPPSITEFTGITDEDVRKAPIFEDIHRSLLAFLKGHVFVAHNVTFDYGFVRYEFDRLGVPFNPDRFCSVQLSRMLFPDQSKHDLSSIVERYGISLHHRHRALDDAMGVWEFFKVIQQEINEDRQHAVLSKILKSTKLLPGELAVKIDHLPYALGVYMFYDTNDVLLFVGKANDIRSKVWDQLINNAKFANVERVAHVETQGKLGALLLESYLVKKHHPLLNRRSRPLDGMTTISVTEDAAGYKHLAVETFKSIQKEDLKQAYTVFRTKKHALKFLEGIAKKYRLDKSFLGLEPYVSPDLSVKAVVHNMRLIEAISKHRKINWPFKEPIVIEENNALKTKGEVFIIDQWIIQQAIKYEAQARDILFETDGTFDFDTYRVLFNYLLKNNTVKPLTLNKNVVLELP